MEEPLECPLITPYTNKKGIDPATLEKLYYLRKWDIQRDEDGVIHNPIPFKWPSLLRKTIWDIDKNCDSGEPLTLRQYQIQQIHHLTRMDKFICGDGVGLGKSLDVVAASCWLKERFPDTKVVIVTTKSTAQPLDAKVLTPTGWVLMGDLKAGDSVVDPDGGIGLVQGVYPQGIKDIYRVTTVDNGTTECCEDHLWTVRTPHSTRTNRYITLSTKELLHRGIHAFYKGKGGKSWVGNKYSLPLPVIEYPNTPPLAGYTLGVLLGDGSITQGQVLFYAYGEDEEVVSKLVSEDLPPEYQISKQAPGQYSIINKQTVQGGNHVRWHLNRGVVSLSCSLCLEHKGSGNYFIETLTKLGLMGRHSHNKFIPEEYFQSSISTRVGLLRGLMDTDGHCKKGGQATYKTTSPQLRDGVVRLVRSLGGLAFISNPILPKTSVIKKEGRNKGKTVRGIHTSWTVTMSTPLNPFSMPRKAKRWNPPRLVRSIKDISFSRRAEAQCINVSTKRNLYITDDYIVTHNTLQWRDEFLRFSHLRPFVMKDRYRDKTSSEARFAQMRDFLQGAKKDVLIVKYDSIKGTRKQIEGKFDEEGNPVHGKEKTTAEMKFYTKLFTEFKDRLILVFDECQKFKGVGTANRNLVFGIARSAGKVWGLTATVMKNSLNEFYAIATALGICPFGYMPEFTEEFCILRPQYIGGGRKKMILVGYQNISKFKEGIRPFFLGRSQRQVKEPLPQLSTTYYPLDLSDQQIDLLDDVQNGVFILPPTLIEVDGELYERERDPDNMMTKLSVQQLVANHPVLLDPTNTKEFYTTKLSPKEEALLDLLDGDLLGEKCIIFTKYKRWIDRLEKLTKEGHFTNRKFLRITGDENETQRNKNKRLFQGSPEHDLIVINSAGIEGINLQQAAHMILLDVPWSWGDLIQLVGRMVRMASPHSACTLHVFVAKGTVDEYAIETLKGKKGVFEKILGESHSAGILDDKVLLDLDSGMEGGSDDEYKSLLKAHVKSVGMKPFLEGEQIEKARGNENYQMVFQKKGKPHTKKGNPLLLGDKGKWGEIELL